MRKTITALFFAMAMGFGAFAQKAKPIEYEKYTLDNGMKVILHQDNSTPIVAVTVMYHVGSKNENPERTGFAHFFEHLLFEGTENIGRGEYMKIVAAKGGQMNANTSQDRTFYYEIFPSNQLELGLWMESERLLHAKIDQIGVDTQREVVKEEKRMRIDNQPYMSFQAKMFGHAFPNHSYQWTPIGSMEHLNAAKLEEFIKFYKHFYVPNNAILSIAGDINLKETKELVAKYFSEIPTGAHKIERPVADENLLTQEVRETVYDNIQIPALITGYKMAAQGTKDFYALELLKTYLADGKSSLMQKELKDKRQMALDIGVFPFSLEQGGLMITFGMPNQGVELDALEKAMDEQIAITKNQKISDRNFQKIRNQVLNRFVSQNASVAGIAESLANYEMYLGDSELINKEIERYMAVTPEDIQRVAKKYLDKNNRIVLTYLPKSAEKKDAQ